MRKLLPPRTRYLGKVAGLDVYSASHVSFILSGAKWKGSKAGYPDSRKDP